MTWKELHLIEEIIDKTEWRVAIEGEYDETTQLEFQSWTDKCQQNVIVSVEASDFQSLVFELERYAEYFDPDEECMTYIKNDLLGKNGVPSSIRDLLEDMDEADMMIYKLAETFRAQLNILVHQKTLNIS